MKNRLFRTFRSVLHEIQTLLITGILTLLPLVLTITAILFCFRIIAEWVAPIRTYEPLSLQAIRFSEYGVIILLILAAGAITRFILFSYVIESFEAILKRVPLVRHIYFGVKQLVGMFTSTGEKALHHRPVLIEFPRSGTYSIGFVTGIVGPSWAPTADEEWISVFVPTTPNPTTGFYLIVPRRNCRSLQLTRQEAMALIISGGVLQPESTAVMPE